MGALGPVPNGWTRCGRPPNCCSIIGVWPGDRLDNGSRMTRERHVRFCERLQGQFQRPTHHFGMKAHVVVDASSGLVHTAGVTSGNVHDAKLMDR